MKSKAIIKMVFSLVWRISKSYVFTLLFSSFSYSGQILCNVIFPKFLIDELMGGKRTEILILYIAVIALSNLLFSFLKKTAKRLLDVKKTELEQRIEKAFAEKVMSVEYCHLEDPAYLDLKERASFAMINQSAVSNLIESVLTMLNETFTIIGLVSIMLQLSWILVAMLLAAVGMILLIQASFSKFQQSFFASLIPVNRRYGYYCSLAFSSVVQKDLRLYDMSEMLGDTLQKYNEEINVWFTKFYRKMGLFMGLFQVIIVLETVIAYGYVGVKTITQGIGIGDLTMYVSAAISFASSVMSLGIALVTIGQMIGYLQPFAELMSVPDENVVCGDRVLKDVDSIRFENVVFSYPGSDALVLNNISFTINKGEKISIVGLNGAGKSTIVKLLCRLYKPNAGRILINEFSITEYENTSYLAAIAAVFQDFKLFNFTIGENISCKARGEDAERIKTLISDVGMSEKLSSLKNGIDSMFGKEYDTDGVEFSGGQSQKIAIARALYKNSSLVVLDEPTSALDPISEAEIYERFNSLIGDKTAIFISHRMSSSVFCDRILVLNSGAIEAFGTHEELMKDVNSLYFKLFNAQAVNYQLDE